MLTFVKYARFVEIEWVEMPHCFVLIVSAGHSRHDELRGQWSHDPRNGYVYSNGGEEAERKYDHVL